MDNPVHDGICLRSAAEPAMPFIDRILSDKDGGMIPAALFKQLIEVLGVFFGKFVIKPLIKDKELIVADPFPVFRKLPEVVVLMRKFLKFVHDDNVYFKYYEVVYILFHTGMRISEFCGLTLRDIDLENKVINIDHQLQRTSDMRLVIESTKTNAGTRKLPMTEDVVQCFRAIIEDREEPKCERVVEGYAGFLFTDKNGYPEVAMHWEHRFNHMVKRYNDIYRVQMPNITPHVCRHTYCSNMAKSGMNPKTLQYLMGHSDIGVTLNTYTHLGLEDATDELKRMEELENARKELEKNKEEKPVSQKIFRAI